MTVSLVPEVKFLEEKYVELGEDDGGEEAATNSSVN
jgi:hypothetical protein